MEPKKLTQLERDMLEECARTHEAIHPGPLLAHIAAVEAERDEAREQAATARAAALEEATIAAKRRLYELGLSASLCCEASNRIRALATTHPPPVVTVAKVREVLRKRLSEADTSGERYVLPMVAGDLGINLDGET